MRFTHIVPTAVLAVGAPAAAYGGLSWASTDASAAAGAEATTMAADQSDPSATAFADCMRSHGVADFPDVAVVDGRIVLDFDGTGIDVFSDTYQEALSTCEADLPEGVELPATPEPPTPSTPPSPGDGEMPPAAPAAPSVPTPPG
jgi:hypothetical protein